MSIDAATRARAASEFLALVEWDWCILPNGNHLHGVRSFEGDDDFVPIGGDLIALRDGAPMLCPSCAKQVQATGRVS